MTQAVGIASADPFGGDWTQAAYERCAEFVDRHAATADLVSVASRGERSSFVRFNGARIRQCGEVHRIDAELRLVRARRSARVAFVLTGDAQVDDERLAHAHSTCASMLADCAEDPLLAYSDQPLAERTLVAARGASPQEIADVVCGAASGLDLAGFLAAGPMMSGYASSLGHRLYHAATSWSFDFAVHAPATVGRDKAIKSHVAGRDWDPEAVARAIGDARARLPLLSRPPVALPPGEHRVLLSPRAVADLVEMLGWGGFSERALRTGQSPLVALRNGERRFDSRLSLSDDLATAGVPRFQDDGFASPATQRLIDRGELCGALVSPRTAREFGVPGTGAGDDERPRAWSMGGGTMDEAESLARLGTGLSIDNLWYLNFSDRRDCRVTGMTRFATFRVEDGDVVGPVDPLRFDDSLYRVFGESLQALTRDTRWLPDTTTYDGRAFGGARMPGALLHALRFTL